MRAAIFITVCLLVSYALGMSTRATAPIENEQFSALAYLPSGAGPMMAGAGAKVNIDLYIDSYTSDDEAKTLAGVLLEGGSDGLLRALQKADTIGKIRLTGRVGFYDLKLIRSHQTQNGRRIYAVGDRPVGFLEAYYSGRSRDYEFGSCNSI
jgi:hypothetical protein